MNKKSNFLYYYIYLTKNMVTGKKYVGWHATNKLYDNYIGSGHLFQKSVKNHGKNNFINGIIEFCTENNFLEREKYWIKEFNTLIPNGYNLTMGGEGNVGYKHTLENIEFFKNRRYSEESKKKMSLSKLGHKINLNRIVSDETKNKISKTLSDKNIDRKKEIEKLYRDGKTYVEIHDILTCSFKTIYKVIKDNNIEKRGWTFYHEPKLSQETKNKLSAINLKKSENKWNDIKDLYLQGKTSREICKLLHCAPNTITKVIKKFNLKRNG